MEDENCLDKKRRVYWKKDNYYGITIKVDGKEYKSCDWDSYKPKKHFERIKQFGYNV